MNFNKINELVNTLSEGVAEIKKYFPNIEENMIRKLIGLDPTYKGNENLGNYGRWILSLYSKGNLKEEDFYKVTDMLSVFEEHKKKLANKDIFQFKILPDLHDAITKLVLNLGDTEMSTRQQQRELKKQGAKDSTLLFEDSEWQIWTPKTYEASCKLGAGTAWCTASGKNDAYYNNYTRQGPLYILIYKNDPEDKYQFHFETDSFMDSADRSIDILKFFDNHSSVKMFFVSLIKDNPKILEHVPPLFFSIENPSDEEISEFLQSIDSDLEYQPETRKIKYEENISRFMDNVVYSGGRGDYISPDTATSLLMGESEFAYDVDIDDGSIGYELKNLRSFTKLKEMEDYLSKINLSVKEIANYFENDRDEDVLEELKEKSGFDDIEEMLDEIGSNARNAKQSGTESEAYDTVMGYLKDNFGDIIREDDKFIVYFTLEDIKDTIDYFGDYGDFKYEGFLTSYVQSRNKGDLIQISEPYNGFDGFDKSYFADETLSQIKYSVTNFIHKEDEE